MAQYCRQVRKMKMLKNGCKVFVLILLVCYFSSCSAQDTEPIALNDWFLEDDLFSQITDELFHAIPTMDREKILSVASRITDVEIAGENGLNFLKHRLLALTFCGEYEKAFDEIINGLLLFPDVPVLLIAKGVLGRRLNYETNAFFDALELIEKQLELNEDNELIVMKYYLRLILLDAEITDSDLAKHRNNDFVYGILQIFSSFSMSELLLAHPAHFIAEERALPRTRSRNVN